MGVLARLGLGRSRPAPADSTFDAELLDGVAAFVETERFLSHLEATKAKASASASASAAAASSSSSATPSTTTTPKQPHLKLVEKTTTTSPSPTSSAAAAAAAAAAEAAKKDDDLSSSGVLVAPSAEGGFVVVTRQDAVEAMAYFIADCLSRSPEAQSMDPKQLQKALGETMASLRRAKWRAVLGWGRVAAQAAAALSYGASLVLSGGPPPALYRAVVAALWAAARMAYRAVS
jgi:hypothetical protein